MTNIDIRLEIAEPFDGLTRILQVLRLAEAVLIGLEVTTMASGSTARVRASVPPERSDTLLRRLAGIIGVSAAKKDSCLVALV